MAHVLSHVRNESRLVGGDCRRWLAAPTRLPAQTRLAAPVGGCARCAGGVEGDAVVEVGLSTVSATTLRLYDCYC